MKTVASPFLLSMRPISVDVVSNDIVGLVFDMEGDEVTVRANLPSTAFRHYQPPQFYIPRVKRGGAGLDSALLVFDATISAHFEIKCRHF